MLNLLKTKISFADCVKNILNKMATRITCNSDKKHARKWK